MVSGGAQIAIVRSLGGGTGRQHLLILPVTLNNVLAAQVSVLVRELGLMPNHIIVNRV